MTTETGRRIDPTIDAMATEVVTTVRHSAIGVGLVLKRWLQFNPRRVAVVAKTGLVAHGTDRFTLGRLRTMTLAEVCRVHITLVVQRFNAFMAIETILRHSFEFGRRRMFG